ncbi:hypothetical protein MHYP_G00302290 [Metynnis hypsauchen]
MTSFTETTLVLLRPGAGESEADLPRLRSSNSEVKCLAQGHKAFRLRARTSEPSGLDDKMVLIALVHCRTCFPAREMCRSQRSHVSPSGHVRDTGADVSAELTGQESQGPAGAET